MKKKIRHMFFCMLTAGVVCAAGITANAATPDGIKQTTGSTDAIRLEWNTVNDTTMEEVNYGYDVATDPSFTNIIQSGLSAITSGIFNYTVVDKLQAGSTYYVRVGYVDIGQKWNDEKVDHHLSAGVDIVTAPANLTSAKFTGANDTSATIIYEGVAGATGYEITYNDQTITTAATTYMIPLIDNAYNKAKVLPFRENSSGYRAYANAEDIYNLSKLTMTIPKDNFGITTALTTSNIFYFEAKGYYGNGTEIELSPVKGSSNTIIGTTEMRGGNIRIDSMQKGVMYQYRMRAYVVTTDNQKVYGNWSDYRYVINPNGSKYIAKNKKIQLKWGKLQGVSKIKVQIATSENGKYKTCKMVSGKKKNYTITKCGKKQLKRNKTYYVRAVFQTKNGESDIYNASPIRVR